MENKPRLNLMDGLIILIILAVIAAGVYLFMGNSGGAAGDNNAEATLRYKVQFVRCEKEVADRFAEAKEKGEAAWVGQKERAEAVIKEVLIEPAKIQTTDTKKQTVVMAEIPDLYDVTVTLESQGKETGRDVRAGDVILHVGEEALVQGKGFAGYGFVIELDVVK